MDAEGKCVRGISWEIQRSDGTAGGWGCDKTEKVRSFSAAFYGEVLLGDGLCIGLGKVACSWREGEGNKRTLENWKEHMKKRPTNEPSQTKLITKN